MRLEAGKGVSAALPPASRLPKATPYRDEHFGDVAGMVHGFSMRRRRNLASPVLLQPRDVINIQVKQSSKLLVIEEPRKAPNLSSRQSIRGAERMCKNAA